jgi:hypothetical protein
MAARRAANLLLNGQRSETGGDSTSGWKGGGDYDFATTATGGRDAYGGDYRAALNAAEKEMNRGYYTSRRGNSYTVQPGDTLSGILGGDMTHVGLVAADNGLKGSSIRARQTIFIADLDQYGADALASFARYGQQIYNQDNSRLEALQQRAQLIANDDGSGSDYSMMRRAQAYGASTMSASGSLTASQMIGQPTYDALGNVTGTEWVSTDNRQVRDPVGEAIARTAKAAWNDPIEAGKGTNGTNGV